MSNPETTAVARLPRTEVAAKDELVSSQLWWALEQTGSPHADIGRPVTFDARVQAEAAAALKRIEPLCAAAGKGVVTAWVKPLLDGITAGHKPTQEEARARLALIVLALQDLAVGAFTQDALAHIARSEVYAPMPATLYAALLPRSVELRQRRDNLRHIATCETEDPPAAPPAPAVVVPLRPAAAETDVDPAQVEADRVEQLRRLGFGPDGERLP